MALKILEKQRGATAGALRVATLGDAVGDFSDFENGISFRLNALEFTGAVKRRDPLAEVVEGQRIPLYVTDDYKGFAETTNFFATDLHGSIRTLSEKIDAVEANYL